ncbi:MAG: transposase [Paracoccus sp. (in: a-proteobacteria)]|uniref:IS66 family transposase n=1 Tax=Microbacterium sp. TaxID=51671 RepID=UPI003A84CC8B
MRGALSIRYRPRNRLHGANSSTFIAPRDCQSPAQLYPVEKEARGSPPDRRAKLCRAHIAPVFDDLEVWLAMQLIRISGKSSLAAAIRYVLTRMEYLRPYLESGMLELDNNVTERGTRTIALGRKNYLFVGSEAGGKAAIIAYTLIETAKLSGTDPFVSLDLLRFCFAFRRAMLFSKKTGYGDNT